MNHGKLLPSWQASQSSHGNYEHNTRLTKTPRILTEYWHNLSNNDIYQNSRYKDGVPIKEDTRVKGVKINAETFELQFQKTTVDDNGNWAVIARNPHGEMSQFFQFAAQMLPKFEKKLSDAEGNEGKQVKSNWITGRNQYYRLTFV